MKKEHILKNNYDFQRIIKRNRPYRHRDFYIYLEKTTDDSYHFGFSVGKKLGNAVSRNKIKRQLKNITSKKDYQNGFNCIIIVSSNILTKSFDEREKELLDIFKDLNILKEK